MFTWNQEQHQHQHPTTTRRLQRKKATSKKTQYLLQANPPFEMLENMHKRRDFIDFVDDIREETKQERKNVYSLEIFPSDMIETFGQWPSK